MTEAKRYQGHCPKCKGDRFADAIADHRESWSQDEYNIWGYMDYRILKCRGCDAVFFQMEETHSECEEQRQDPVTGEWETFLSGRIQHFPEPKKREQPAWSYRLAARDKDMSRLFDDVYVALENDLSVLSAIGIRTVFDRSSELLDISRPSHLLKSWTLS